MKIFLSSLLLCCIFNNSNFAQKNISLYNLKGTPQALYTNPAFIPKTKFYLSLPMGLTSIGVSNAFSFNDLFTQRSDDSLVFNAQQVVDKLHKKNTLNFETSIELFVIGLKVRDFNVNFTVNNKFQTNFIYPKDMMQFLLEGNGKSFIGKRISFDGLGVNVMDFTEFGLGFSKEIGDKLTIGGKVKLLAGLLNFTTKKSKLGLYTDPESFDLTLDGQMEFNSSNSFRFLNDSSANANPFNFSKDIFGFKNSGFGMDLGATYKLNDKFTLNASIIDLGAIKWNANVVNYATNEVNYTFKGVNLNNYFSADSTKNQETPLQEFIDTIPKIFNYAQNNDAYSTSLYTKFYIGGNFELTKSVNVGALLLNEFVKGRYKPAFSLSVNASLKSWLSATVNYSMYNKTYTNVGVGLSIAGGGVQFIIMTDNILGFTNILKAKSVNLSFGTSILIKDKSRKRKEKTKTDTGIL